MDRVKWTFNIAYLLDIMRLMVGHVLRWTTNDWARVVSWYFPPTASPHAAKLANMWFDLIKIKLRDDDAIEVKNVKYANMQWEYIINCCQSRTLIFGHIRVYKYEYLEYMNICIKNAMFARNGYYFDEQRLHTLVPLITIIMLSLIVHKSMIFLLIRLTNLNLTSFEFVFINIDVTQ